MGWWEAQKPIQAHHLHKRERERETRAVKQVGDVSFSPSSNDSNYDSEHPNLFFWIQYICASYYIPLEWIRPTQKVI